MGGEGEGENKGFPLPSIPAHQGRGSILGADSWSAWQSKKGDCFTLLAMTSSCYRENTKLNLRATWLWRNLKYSNGAMTMHHEEKVFWSNGSLTGEGLWHSGAVDAGAVICHPHPLMGGSMHNNVVETVRNVWSAAGFSTLRFNFRGVGKSTGRYDEGRGEKQDLLSACAYAKSRGVKKLFLIGYSFGAWICCRLLRDNPSVATSVLLVSPPLQYFEFDWDGLENTVELMICGDQDTFCDVETLSKKAESISAKLTILSGADHFYFGHEARLAEDLKRYIHEKKA